MTHFCSLSHTNTCTNNTKNIYFTNKIILVSFEVINTATSSHKAHFSERTSEAYDTHSIRAPEGSVPLALTRLKKTYLPAYYLLSTSLLAQE